MAEATPSTSKATVQVLRSKYDGLFVQDERYYHEFSEIVPLERGSYGYFYKAKHAVDDKRYAIKICQIESTLDYHVKLKQLKLWAKLDCEYIVQYRSSWAEMRPNQSVETANLYVQMDLCSLTLKDALIKLREDLNLTDRKATLPKIGYYVMSEIYFEIMRAVDYLHSKEPPIMHRDLNPLNILLMTETNGNFVKIGDFGFAMEHMHSQQSPLQLRHSLKYMAPEILQTRNYIHKVDIYSVGVVAQDIFNFDVNHVDLEKLSKKYHIMIEITAECLSNRGRERPSAASILERRQEWGYDFSEVRDEIISFIDQNQKYDIKEEFTRYFLQNKLKLNENREKLK